MNPLGLDVALLIVLGWTAHVIGDLLLQHGWMVAHKAERRPPRHDRWIRRCQAAPTVSAIGALEARYQDALRGRWWDRHPAAYAHAGVHGLLLAPLFGWVSLPLAVTHLLIDTRVPVDWWGRLMAQTAANPEPDEVIARIDTSAPIDAGNVARYTPVDVGLLVRMMVDQAMHITLIAVAALLVGGVS